MGSWNAARNELNRGHGGECGNEGARPRHLRDSACVNSGQRSGPVKQREGLWADSPRFNSPDGWSVAPLRFHAGLSVTAKPLIPHSKPRGGMHVLRRPARVRWLRPDNPRREDRQAFSKADSVNGGSVPRPLPPRRSWWASAATGQNH